MPSQMNGDWRICKKTWTQVRGLMQRNGADGLHAFAERNVAERAEHDHEKYQDESFQVQAGG